MKKQRISLLNERPAGSLSPELARALVELTTDEDMQLRYQELSTRRKLSLGEQEELEAIIRGNVLVGMLKAEARFTLGISQHA